MVLVRDIDMAFLSQENLLPRYGKCHVAYIPARGRVVGLSKLARLVRVLCRRVTTAEAVCAGVVGATEELLLPKVCLLQFAWLHTCPVHTGQD